MKIVSHKRLVEFYNAYPNSKISLEEWYQQTKQAKWKCFADIKKDYSTVDGIGGQRYVFNIKGNEYRLVVVIQFTHGYVYIRFVGKHSAYDKIDCHTI